MKLKADYPARFTTLKPLAKSRLEFLDFLFFWEGSISIRRIESLFEADEIREAAVLIPLTVVDGESIDTEMRAGEICYSACPYVLAAGVHRKIDDAASVGVHQHYFGESTILPASFAVEDIQRGQGEVMIYLDAMGIDPLVMQHALTTPPDEIYVLLPEQLVLYGFSPDA